ncbi:DNA repair metallo-beta-lactamase-domain-containing protein [Dissophora ornata]|nr:DNA repair metallo-beta-lactamase-domain-containing protein [Dissophora ornata]
MDANHRKHDLEPQSNFEPNVVERPIPAKKRILSLRRPRTHSPSPPSSVSSVGAGIIDCVAATTITTLVPTSPPTPTTASLPSTPSTLPATTAVEDVQQDARLSGSVKEPKKSNTPTKDSDPWSLPSVPDCTDQEERHFQEIIGTEIRDLIIPFATEGMAEEFNSAEADDSEDIQEAEQTNDIAGQGYAIFAALRETDLEQEEDGNGDEAFLNCNSKTRPSIFDPQLDIANDPDCNEDNEDDMLRGEFPDMDKIQEWDMGQFEIDHDPGLTGDSTPENSCPICGLDLMSLDTMTPDAHVNRCLDGSTPDPIPTASERPATTQPISSNPLSSIIGTIRSVITNLPSRSGSGKTALTATQPPGNKGKWHSKPKTPRPCPFYKKMPDTSFTVDAFCYGAIEGCNAYFLSHFHSDHYGGLTATWNHGPIYCSSITANLVISRLRVDSQRVRRLPMYEPTVINGVTVRLMDANHCPGSVLFVFDLQNPRRRYLHTGDFRACPEMSVDPILRQPQNLPIDILYLDTTYSNPRYTFPPQDLVIRETASLVCKEVGIHNSQAATQTVIKVTKKVNIMESWLKKESGNSEKLLSMSIKTSQSIRSKQQWQEPKEKNKIVVCVGTYLIGKERVFMAIAKAIGSKVFVQHSKLQLLACLEDPELMSLLTSNPLEAQVHLLHMGSEMSPESLQDYLDSLSPTFSRLIAIRPTGWTFTGSKKYTSVETGSSEQTIARTPTTLELKPSFTSTTVKIYPVPYSEHSSFSELAGFVRSLNILKIIPTVGVGSEKGRHTMHEWFKRWEDERRQGIGWE